jgi:hypothetical protein
MTGITGGCADCVRVLHPVKNSDNSIPAAHNSSGQLLRPAVFTNATLPSDHIQQTQNNLPTP